MANNHLNHIIPLVDLTRLYEDDDDAPIIKLCQQAHTPYGDVATICVYPRFIHMAKTHAPDIKIATVINFPNGDLPLDETISEIHLALALGADEIDLVMPYHQLDDSDYVRHYLSHCRQQVTTTLKIILETGALDDDQIKQATQLAIESGTDFIKTSTGKIEVGATLNAANIMLQVIAQQNPDCGIKLSGGIKTFDTIEQYLNLIREQMGPPWINPKHVRFGASTLLNHLPGNV